MSPLHFTSQTGANRSKPERSASAPLQSPSGRGDWWSGAGWSGTRTRARFADICTAPSPHGPNPIPEIEKELLVMDPTEIGAELAAAATVHDAAVAEHDGAVLLLNELSRQLAARKVGPAMSDFESARLWRDARDDWRFERNALTARIRTAETTCWAAVAAMSDSKSRLDAARLKLDLVHAANAAIATGPCAFPVGPEMAEATRIAGGYFAIPIAVRGHDPEFADRLSVSRIWAMVMAGPTTAGAMTS